MSYSIVGTITPAWDSSGSGSTVQSATTGLPALLTGDYVIVAVPYTAGSDATQTVTDSLSNTYTEDTTGHFWLSTSNNKGARFFYSKVTNAGTPTFIKTTAGVSCTFLGCFPTVIRGLTSSALQVVGAYKRTAGAPATTDALTSNAVTVSTPPAAVMCFAFNLVGSNGATLTVGTGETLLQTGQKSNGLADFVKVAHKRVTATGSVSATFTPAQGGDDWVANVMVFTELNTSPLITSTSTATPNYQGSMTVTGSIFGSTQGIGNVTLGNVTQTNGTWSDTSIPLTSISRGTNKYGVELDLIVNTNSNGASNTYTGVTALLPQTGWSYVDLGTPNTTSANRITAVADLASGDQLAYDNKGGLVTISADATFVADPSVTSFNVEAWFTGNGWGTTATQTLASGGIVQSVGTIAKASLVSVGGIAVASLVGVGGASYN